MCNTKVLYLYIYIFYELRSLLFIYKLFGKQLKYK